MKKRTKKLLSVWCGVVGAVHAAQAAGTLDKIRQQQQLTCGVVTDLDDWSEADTHGDLSRLGADFCRAMAAEILGDAGKAQMLPANDEPDALAALRDGKTDVLFGATPHPLIGQTYGVGFGPPIFFDGQGFLVAKDGGIGKISDLSGRSVCFINASPAEQILYDALEPNLADKESRFPYSERGEMEVALVDGHCDAITGDISWLANVRAALHAQVSRFVVLPDMISVDPMAPAFRAGDAQWAALVDWTVWALLQAEAHGVTQESVGTPRNDRDPVVRRLAGSEPWIGASLGVPDDAFARAIAAVGNYGEIYARDVTAPLGLPRGRNELAEKGGLMWALPVEPLP